MNNDKTKALDNIERTLIERQTVLVNGILFALQQLNKAMTTQNHRVYNHISEAIDSLSAVLKNNS